MIDALIFFIAPAGILVWAAIADFHRTKKRLARKDAEELAGKAELLKRLGR